MPGNVAIVNIADMISIHRFSRSMVLLAIVILTSALPARAEEKLGDLRGVAQVSFNHDGSRVIVASESGGVQIFEVTTGKRVAGDAALKTGGDFVVSEDGKRFVAAIPNSHSRVFDATTGKALSPFLDLPPGGESGKWAVFSREGDTLLVFGEKETAILSLATGKRVATIPMEKGDDMQMAAGSAVFAAGGALCFVMNAKGEVTRYDTKDGKPVGKPLQHPAADSAMDFFQFVSEDGKWMVTTDFPGENGPTGNAQVWDVAAEKPLGEPLVTKNGWSACFLGNNRVLLIPERPGEQAKINAHDLPSMNVSFTVRDHDDLDGPKTAVSRDGKWLLSWPHLGNGSLDLYDVAAGKLESYFSSKAAFSTVQMAPDSSGCFVAFNNSAFEDQGYQDNYVVKLSFPEMKVTQSLRFTENVTSASLSPDGKRLLVEQGEKGKERLLFYDAGTLKPLK